MLFAHRQRESEQQRTQFVASRHRETRQDRSLPRSALQPAPAPLPDAALCSPFASPLSIGLKISLLPLSNSASSSTLLAPFPLLGSITQLTHLALHHIPLAALLDIDSLASLVHLVTLTLSFDFTDADVAADPDTLRVVPENYRTLASPLPESSFCLANAMTQLQDGLS
jgi:hypothetical protein